MSTATTTSVSRKQKWHSIPPPPPTPKILNLPRRNRHRRQLKKPTTRKPSSGYLKLEQNHPPQGHLLEFQEGSYCYCSNDRKGKLESLFGEEREFSRSECGSNVPIVLLNSSASSSSSATVSGGGRRERVEEGGGEGGLILEEKWKFQAEILTAECNFLRKEKELAFKKMERKTKRMEKCLHSAVQTLQSGKTKMLEGNNLNIVLEEEIENMIQKLEHLQRGSGNKDMEVKKCSNFDKQASFLQKRLEKLGGLSEDQCVNKLMADIDKESCVLGPRNHGRFITDEEMQRMKMEGLPKEFLDRIFEDCGTIPSTPANSSVASSTSTSKRIESLPESTFSTRQLWQEPLGYDDSKCSGRCKSIVRKIVEQVRAETEQWTQMQVMLGKVREEMQQLQVSCDFWEQRAITSENQIQYLQSSVGEWKEKALDFETKANKLQTELSAAKGEIQKLKTTEHIEPRRGGVDPQSSSLFPLRKQLEEKTNRTYKIDVKTCNEVTNEVKSSSSTKPQPISLGKQLEKEKRMLLRRLKEKQYYGKENGGQNEEVVIADRRSKTTQDINNKGHVTRSPFRDIVNFSPLKR